MKTFDRVAMTYNLTPRSLKSDKVENLTFVLTFDTEERVGRRGHHDDFCIFDNVQHDDTVSFTI